jgi:hypothetical protein
MNNYKLKSLFGFSFFFSFLGTSVTVFSQTNTPCSAAVVIATPIAVNGTCTLQSGTNVGATALTNAANGGTPSCGSMGPDVWYSFIAPTTASYQINTELGTLSDGVMSLYSGSCNAWLELECNDDFIGLSPQITRSLVSGTRYLIRYWGYGGETGTFSICVQQLIALPLNLLSFNGQRVGNRHVLDWKTAMEENTSHFEIEKSLDGVNFTFLAQIVAVGSGANNYAVTDAQLQVGANYYRLKSVDKDGRYTYSKTILLQVTTNSIDRSLLVYPSVAQTKIQVIAAAGSIQGNAVITIYSLAGQKMTSITNRGQQPTIIDISSYSAGTYIVELVSAEVLLRTKFVKAE